MLSKSVSIIVCFYNGGDKLIRTIEHLKALSISTLESVELIFVDNNSNDNSQEIIERELSGFTIYPWKIIVEKTPGLSSARLAGINEAQHEILLFCDDDNWFATNYLELGVAIFQTNNKIGIIGGKGTAVADIEIPSWFEENQNFYAVGPQMPQNGIVRGVRNVVYGAGMFMRKSYFRKIEENGFQSISSDRIGNKLASGGDSEICLAFQIAGYLIWYDENLTFHHYIETKRLNLDYINKLLRGMEDSRFLLRFYLDFLLGYQPKITKYFWLKELIYAVKELLLMFLTFNLKGIKRSWSFCKYLLSERQQYNQNVRQIYSLCIALQAIKNN